MELDEAHALNRRLLELLADVWMQFSVEGTHGGEPIRHDGGLSVLDDVFEVLSEADAIDCNGHLRKRATGARP